MHDKTFWQAVLDADAALPPDESLADLTTELLDYLRSPDMTLRDTYSYQILTQWILSGQYDKAQLAEFQRVWLADLEVGIGENGTQTVIQRSFAVLMLSILIYQDMRESYLSEAELQAILQGGLAYFAAEQDWRGYDETVGWLHSVAHTADLLKFTARNSKTGQADLERILNAIADKLLSQQGTTFIFGEDERLAMSLMDVVKRQILSPEILTAFLERLATVLEQMKANADFNTALYASYQNCKHVLRALYFRLAYSESSPNPEFQAQLLEALKKFQQ